MLNSSSRPRTRRTQFVMIQCKRFSHQLTVSKLGMRNRFLIFKTGRGIFRRTRSPLFVSTRPARCKAIRPLRLVILPELFEEISPGFRFLFLLLSKLLLSLLSSRSRPYSGSLVKVRVRKVIESVLVNYNSIQEANLDNFVKQSQRSVSLSQLFQFL